MNITKASFSPSGTTRRVVDLVTRELTSAMPQADKKVLDFLNEPFSETVVFGQEDVLVIGLPVYYGRIPDLSVDWVKQLEGNGTKAVALAVYGNRDYDDALLELAELLTAQGFEVIGAAAFIAQHSIFSEVAAHRPDDKDRQLLASFGSACAKKLLSGASALDVSRIKGNHPYKAYGTLPFKPSAEEDECIRCGMCASLCPAHAISPDEPYKTKEDICISCTACIAVCPVSARAFKGDAFKLKARAFGEACAERKEPEAYL